MGGLTEARRSGARLPCTAMDETIDTMKINTEVIDTVVIGAGPAGLVAAYHLQRAGVSFVVLEASGRVGDSWRARYDGLRLFSLPHYASLPGWRIPVREFPTRDEMADYVEAYAARFDLPVRAGARVRRVGRVGRAGAGFTVETDTDTYTCAKVVVAAGIHTRPLVPALACDLDPGLTQLHSLDYRNPGQLAPGGVLVVGAANSGTDIALESAAAGHPTWLAGRHPGQLPVNIDRRSAQVLTPVFMFVHRHVLTLDTPMGRRVAQQLRGHGVTLIRNKLADLDAAGIVRIGRITDVRDGRPVSDDGARPDVATVVWCTGSTPDHSFLDLPVFAADGAPLHTRGVAAETGLYFLGLQFQYALASSTLQGLDRDARHVVRHLLRCRTAATVPA
jgi:putative flavoprotein involved in K+ transport